MKRQRKVHIKLTSIVWVVLLLLLLSHVTHLTRAAQFLLSSERSMMFTSQPLLQPLSKSLSHPLSQQLSRSLPQPLQSQLSQTLPQPLPQELSQLLPQPLPQLMSQSPVPLPRPKAFVSPDAHITCPDWEHHTSCSCYRFDDSLFIECTSTGIERIAEALNLSPSTAIKSISIYYLNSSIVTFPNRLFYNTSSVQHLQMSYTSLANLSSEAFQGLEESLKTLSVVNSKLCVIPNNAINKLKNLESLDFESNSISDVESYAFYGLPLLSLNLQGNSIGSLLEYSFAGLENTLEELVLINNMLKRFPLTALRRLRKLQILKLQSNQIAEIPDDGFTRFTVLKNLDLQSNSIDHLDARSFITMPRLVTLSLANNKLTKLNDNGVFIHLLDLETLDLSSNNLRSVDLSNLSTLRTLDLSNNHLHAIELHNMPNLKELFLSHNNILEISNDTFMNTTQITVLYLQHNAIHTITHNAFHTLPFLFTLDLSYNQLREIHPNLLKHTDKLQSLYLDNNLLVDTGLEPGTFQELVELRDLRLQKNLLKRIRKGVFYSLPNLQELDIQMNRIEMIESLESLVNLQHLNIHGNKLIEIGDVLSKYPSSLRFLQLSNNQIFTIHNGSLNGQTQLEVLWLNYNKLQRLTRSIFRDLTELQKIYLNNNEIAVIEDNTFEALKSLMYLNLEHNNLNHISVNMFVGAVSLVELRFSGSNIMDIEPNAFQSMKMLKILDLSDNQIYVIRKYMFAGDLPIEELKLSNIMADEIEAHAFMELDSLRSLDISMNNLSKGKIDFLFLPKVRHLDMSGNDLTTNLMDKSPFHALPELEYLDLSLTHLNLTDGTGKLFQRLNSLRVLKLRGNSIVTLESESFHSTMAIKELYLDDNQLETVPKADVFGMMPNLEILSLSSNHIKHIVKGAFRNSTYLRILNISDNSVSVLDSRAFENLTSLQQLDLSNNVIRSVTTGVFDNIDTLESVILDGNWFQCIPNNLIRTVLPHLKTLTMNRNPILRIREDLSISGGFPSLVKLTIDEGNLSIIASHDFFGFPNLEFLSVRGNQIQKISPSAFRPLNRVRVLDLSHNRLEILPEERLSGLLQLKKLNLTFNNLLELPHFSSDLMNLEILDVSYNRLTRVDTFGHLGSTVTHISLRHNMIGWIGPNAFQNMSSLQQLDLRQNFLNHLSDSIFDIIEVRIETLLLSGNPLHCDCRLLSIHEWLMLHSRLIPDRDEMICVQPEKLKDNIVLSLHSVDFCPVPQITILEINKLESTRIVIHWEVQNVTLVGGFTLDYHLTSERTPIVTNKNLAQFDRHLEITKLLPETWYTICVQANGKYLRTDGSKPTPYVVDHQKNFGEFVTSNRRCLQVRTLSHNEKTLIFLSTLGIIVGCVISVVLVLTSCVLIAVYKYRRRRRRPLKNDVPEEYITYRHFSLPSSENVYS